MKKLILLTLLLLPLLTLSQAQVGNDIDGESSNDYSGWSVSIDSDGSHVAIGAYGNNGNGSDSGHVRIYEYSGSAWSQLGNDIDGEAVNDNFGYSVSIDSDGSHVAIGAYLNNGNGSDSGHVRIYEYSSGSWSQVGNDIDGEAANDRSGRSVSIDSDGSHVAIGSPNKGNDKGHVRVYDVGAPTIHSVSLAADNSTIAVTFSKDVYNTNAGSGALEVSDFALSISGVVLI